MTNKYYECHITMMGNSETIKPIVEETKWKFSCIDGDPVLGDGVKCYATKQFKGTMIPNLVKYTLEEVAKKIENQGIDVIRKKIELVIFDDRSSKIAFECNGGCPECHTDDFIDRKGPPVDYLSSE